MDRAPRNVSEIWQVWRSLAQILCPRRTGVIAQFPLPRRASAPQAVVCSSCTAKDADAPMLPTYLLISFLLTEGVMPPVMWAPYAAIVDQEWVVNEVRFRVGTYVQTPNKVATQLLLDAFSGVSAG